MQPLSTLVLSLALFTPFLAAQAKDAKAEKTAAPAAMPLPKPQKEHELLKQSEGTWDCAIDSMGQKSKGSSVMKLGFNGLFLVDDFTCDFGGAPFQGHGVLGYDTHKGRYVETWCDTMTTEIMVMEGSYDRKTNALTMTGSVHEGMTGQLVKMRLVTTWKDANTMVFEMFNTGADGKEVQAMTITYTRHK
ncbi:MAG TPA: DUF1579 domain-containing protein [Planctomycetota bacterium]|nr:DUF1579 domain-containing protein [Planctomycetota bacterium]